MAKPEVAYIGLGSNLDTPQNHVQEALGELASLRDSEFVAASSLYSSPPMGPPDQPNYINAVAAVLTRLKSDELLKELQLIERGHGRTRDGVHWGPRTLDLDILLFGNEQRDDDHLQLPHPGLKVRDFVVLPLAELAPDLVLPCGTRIATLATQMQSPPGPSAIRLESE